MSDIIGFDLGLPRVEIKKYMPGHYALVFLFLEVHLLVGKARDLTLDVMNKGIEAIGKEKK